MVCFCLSCMANSKFFCQHMLIYYFLLLPQHNFDYIMFRIQLPVVQKFNQNVVARCLLINLKHAYQSNSICPSSLFLSKASPKQNLLQISIVTMFCWSKYIYNLIILMNMYFFPTQICSHYLLTCSLCALLIGNMNYLWNVL
jgi:hypothetical protein